MPSLMIYVSDEAYEILEKATDDLERPISDIAAAAVEEAALQYKMTREPTDKQKRLLL